MRDVFGRKLLKVYSEKNHNILIAAWTREEAIELLLTKTNMYGSLSDMNIVSVKGLGYAGTQGKIIL